MSRAVTCLFWNTNRRDLTSLIGRLCADANADVVALAEPTVEPRATLEVLQRLVDRSYFEPETDTRRLHLFARDPQLDLHEVYGDLSGRVTMRVLRFQETEFLFAAVHLPSSLHWNCEDQAAEVQVLADELRREENRRGHRRTVVTGDFNMNPFAVGLVQASGMHAMMTRRSVRAGSRIVQGREYPFFYNPMWGFFGDRTEGPPGTYYYRHAGHVSYDWNLFDQVLVRPDALSWFRGDVRIVTQIGDTSLLRPDGRPDVDVGSDHLPIVFRLEAAN